MAAVGNGYLRSAVEYPAALLQPIGSNGIGCPGLSVAASTSHGDRAPFSSTGSHSRSPRRGRPSSARSPLRRRPRTIRARRSRAPSAVSTASAAAPRSRRRRSPAPRHSSGRRTPSSGRTRWRRSSSRPRPGRATGTPARLRRPRRRRCCREGAGDAVVASGSSAAGASVVRVQLRGKRVGTRVALWWHASGTVAVPVSLRSGKGPQRVLTAAASRRSAAYALGRGAYPSPSRRSAPAAVSSPSRRRGA